MTFADKSDSGSRNRSSRSDCCGKGDLEEVKEEKKKSLTTTENPSDINNQGFKMSSGCGLSSSSTTIFGGLCSSNTRRPSMFTAKYRLREERKKVSYQYTNCKTFSVLY